MSRHVRTLCGAAVVSCVSMMAATGTASAETVTMRLNSGGFSVEGDLVGFDGKAYVIRSRVFGTMSLDAGKFDCVGAACPQAKAWNPYAPESKGSVAKSARPGKPVRPVNFAVHGSNTIGSTLMPALIRSYAKSIGATVESTPGKSEREVSLKLAERDGKTLAKIDLQRYGSATAFPALGDGKAQIGMADRPITAAEEVPLLAKTGVVSMRAPGQEHVIGLDGILVVVSPRNSVASLSATQLAKIFSGEIRDWSEVGAPPGKIRIYAPGEKSGTFSTFRSLVLKPRKLKIASNAQRFTSYAKIADLVANDQRGIGITGFAHRGETKPLAIKSTCGFVHRPTGFNVKTGEYPLSRFLYLYTAGRLGSPYADALLNFAKSDPAQSVSAKLGFIDQSIASMPFGQQGNRVASALAATSQNFDMGLMRQLILDFKSARRLSSTFRFETGSWKLDSRSQQEIGRLARSLQSETYRGKQVILAGFADAAGSFASNRKLSLTRAQKVRKALLAASDSLSASRIAVRAYSELMPVGCNTTELGKQKNRRVEVWVGEQALSVLPKREESERPRAVGSFTRRTPRR